MSHAGLEDRKFEIFKQKVLQKRKFTNSKSSDKNSEMTTNKNLSCFMKWGKKGGFGHFILKRQQKEGL